MIEVHLTVQPADSYLGISTVQSGLFTAFLQIGTEQVCGPASSSRGACSGGGLEGVSEYSTEWLCTVLCGAFNFSHPSLLPAIQVRPSQLSILVCFYPPWYRSADCHGVHTVSPGTNGRQASGILAVLFYFAKWTGKDTILVVFFFVKNPFEICVKRLEVEMVSTVCF